MEELIKKNAARALNTEIRPFPTSYPGGITPDTLFDGRTEKIIAAQADKMVATGLFEKHERDDVANELRIILAYEMVNFNPSKDRYVFTATVLAKRGVNELIRRGCELRDNPRPISLDTPVNGQSGETFADNVSAEEYASFWSSAASSGLKKRLVEKLDDIISALDRIDQAICRLLMEGRSIRFIADSLGMTHTGVRYHIRKMIAPAFGICNQADTPRED